MKFTEYEKSFATFSEDNKNRYSLFRQWDSSLKVAMVIGLNPSNANGEEDDPTIGFLYRVLKHNGYGGFFMMNLFTMITPKPSELVIDYNWRHAKELWEVTAPFCQDVVFAWGAFKTQGREKTAIDLFPQALCFGKLKKGQPRHPMYLKNETQLIKYSPSQARN